jgi:hypothetical protein
VYGVILARNCVLRTFTMTAFCVSCVNLIGLFVGLMATVILLASYNIEAYPLYFPNRTPPDRVQENESAMEGAGTMNACPPGTRRMNGICRTPYGRWLSTCAWCVVEVGAIMWLSTCACCVVEVGARIWLSTCSCCVVEVGARMLLSTCAWCVVDRGVCKNVTVYLCMLCSRGGC